MMMRRANTDLLTGLVGLIVFTVFWLAREDWRRPSAVWPETILIGLVLLSGALVVKSLLKWRTFEVFTEGSRKRMAVAAGYLVVWALGLQFVGFLVTTACLFPLLAWWMMGEERRSSDVPLPPATLRNWALWLLIMAVEIAALYAVFAYVLLVPLPEGIAI